jgi:hypothetical protein
MGKRKQARELVQRLGSERFAAYHDARRLALQIADGGPYPPVDVYSYGLVANDGEQLYRVFWMHWHVREIWTDNRIIDPRANRQFPVWPQPQPAHLMLTDQGIACRDHDGELFSIYWNGLSGFQVDVPFERITLHYQDGRAGAFTGTAAPVLAVAAIAHLYGTEGLLQHPAMRVLHAPRTLSSNVGKGEVNGMVGARTRCGAAMVADVQQTAGRVRRGCSKISVRDPRKLGILRWK